MNPADRRPTDRRHSPARAPRRATPTLLRGVSALAVGLALAIAPAGLAQAHDDHSGHDHAQPQQQNPIPPVRVLQGGQPAEDAAPINRLPPPLKVEPERIDMGHLEPGASRAGVVKLTNFGDETLKISRVASTCSCTVADLPKETLEPGESVELSATLEAGKYIGPMQRQVRVFVEGYAAPKEVWVVADVSHAVKAEPVYLNAFQTKSGEITLTAVDGKPFRVVSVNCEAPSLKDFNPETDEPRTSYTVQWDFTDVNPNDLSLWWIVETDHPGAPVVDLRVIHPAVIPRQDARRPWTLPEDRALLGFVAPGQPVEFTVEVKERRRSPGDEENPVVVSKNEGVSVEVVKVEATQGGAEITLSLTAQNSDCTLLREPLSLQWRDHEETLWVFGRVMEAPAGQAMAPAATH